MTKIVINESGYFGLFRGLSSTIAREMPGYFFFFGAYEGTRELFTKPGQTRDDIGWVKTMIAGAAGGVVLWLVIFPADLVKSRIQVIIKTFQRNFARLCLVIVTIIFER